MSFIDYMNSRHACKSFNDKKIPDDSFREILEYARMSPSSFGMEPWRIRIIEEPTKREELRAACWNQPQITEASHAIVISTITKDLEPGSDYVVSMFSRRDLPADALAAYLQKYAEHHKSEIAPVMSLYSWGSKQCYLALANMLTGAASLGIDSCPIEGFEKEPVESLLEMDTEAEEVCVVATFGYRKNPQPAHLRKELSQITTWI